MERLVALGAVLALVSVCHTSPQNAGTVAGGNFGPGSFSTGGSGGGRPTQTHVYENKDDDDGGNTQLYPVKPKTTHAIEIQGSMGDEGSAGGDQVYTDTVILPNNKNNKGNRKKNGNKQPITIDASVIEAVFGKNGMNNGLPSAENGITNTNEQGSIQIDSITGGDYKEGTLNLNNTKSTGKVPLKDSAVNNENDNAENEALYSIGHGANSNGAGNGGEGYNHGQIKSGHNSESGEERWIWSR